MTTAEGRPFYPQQVAHRAPFVFMTETIVFLLFILWRAGGMMLLGMALYKARFLDGGWSNRAYAIVAGVCLTLGWSLAGYGVGELEGIRFMSPQRSTVDLWNYTGAVFASVGYAAALLLLVTRQALAALRRRLAALGQTALSNSLCQSIMTAITDRVPAGA